MMGDDISDDPNETDIHLGDREKTIDASSLKPPEPTIENSDLLDVSEDVKETLVALLADVDLKYGSDQANSSDSADITSSFEQQSPDNGVPPCFHCAICGVNAAPTFVHCKRIPKPSSKRRQIEWIWRYKCRRRICWQFFGHFYVFNKALGKFEMREEDPNFESLPWFSGPNMEIPACEYEDLLVATKPLVLQKKRSLTQSPRAGTRFTPDSSPSKPEYVIKRTRSGSPIRNGTQEPIRIKICKLRSDQIEVKVEGTKTTEDSGVDVKPSIDQEVYKSGNLSSDNNEMSVVEETFSSKHETVDDCPDNSQSTPGTQSNDFYSNMITPPIDNEATPSTSFEEKPEKEKPETLTRSERGRRGAQARKEKREAMLAARIAAAEERKERKQAAAEAARSASSSPIIVPTPPNKKNRKGYVYVVEPIAGCEPTPVAKQEDVVDFASPSELTTEPPVYNSGRFAPSRSRGSSVRIRRNISDRDYCDEETQTGCIEHMMASAVDDLKMENLPLSNAVYRRMLLSVKALEAANTKASKLLAENERLRETARKMSALLDQFKNAMSSEIRRIRDDVGGCRNEMKHFHTELTNEADRSRESWDETRTRVGNKIDDLDRDNRKLSSKIELAERKFEQAQIQADRYHRELSEKDRLVILTKAQKAEIQKKLDDKLYIANNAKCANCSSSHNARKHYEELATEKAAMADKYSKEKNDVARKLNNAERMLQMLSKDMEKLKFESQAYKMDNEKLVKELNSVKGQLELLDCTIPSSTSNSTSKNYLLCESLTPADTVSTPSAKNDSPDSKASSDGSLPKPPSPPTMGQGSSWMPRLDKMKEQTNKDKATVSHNDSPKKKKKKKHNFNEAVKEVRKVICVPNIIAPAPGMKIPKKRTSNAFEREEDHKKKCLTSENSPSSTPLQKTQMTGPKSSPSQLKSVKPGSDSPSASVRNTSMVSQSPKLSKVQGITVKGGPAVPSKIETSIPPVRTNFPSSIIRAGGPAVPTKIKSPSPPQEPAIPSRIASPKRLEQSWISEASRIGWSNESKKHPPGTPSSSTSSHVAPWNGPVLDSPQKVNTDGRLAWSGPSISSREDSSLPWNRSNGEQIRPAPLHPQRGPHPGQPARRSFWD